MVYWVYVRNELPDIQEQYAPTTAELTPNLAPKVTASVELEALSLPNIDLFDNLFLFSNPNVNQHVRFVSRLLRLDINDNCNRS